MKRIFLIIIPLLMFSGSAFADSECCSNGCYDSCFRSLISPGGFYIGLTGMYVVPSETGLGNFTDSWQYADATGVTSLSKPSKAKYKGAGAVKLGYDFPGSANNLEVEYVHLDNSKHNFNDTSDVPVSFGSVFFNLVIPTPPGTVFVSDSYLKYSLNQVDVSLGHRFIGACGRLQLRPLFGVRYTNLRHHLKFLVGDVRTTYRGAGPMIGIDGLYNLWRNLCITTRFDSSVLMGTVNANSVLRFGTEFRFKSPSTDRIISTFGGRIGLAYNFCLCRSRVGLELGYQANIYIGPFDTITGITDPQRIHSIDTNNFAYSGPYLTLNWHM